MAKIVQFKREGELKEKTGDWKSFGTLFPSKFNSGMFGLVSVSVKGEKQGEYREVLSANPVLAIKDKLRIQPSRSLGKDNMPTKYYLQVFIPYKK